MADSTITVHNFVFNSIPSRVKPGSRPHRVAGATVFRNGEAAAELAIDYYTPMNTGARRGFYVAFRKPGYSERQRPKLRIWLGEDISSATQIGLTTIMYYVANHWFDAWNPKAKRTSFVNDPRVTL